MLHGHPPKRLPGVFNRTRICSTNFDFCAKSNLMLDKFEELVELKGLSKMTVLVSFETLRDQVHLFWIPLQDLLDIDPGLVDNRRQQQHLEVVILKVVIFHTKI